MKISERRRGRPRQFDPAEALDAATQVFWTRGYAEASLDELTAAMKITRPSLYAAFGDKETLMLACISRYGRWVESAVSAALTDDRPPQQCLARMYGDAIALYTMPAPEPRGCLLASACLADVPLSPAIRKATGEALADVETIVRDFFAATGLAGRIAACKARMATTFLYGLASRARLGAPAAVLLDDAKRFSAMLAP